MSDLPDLTDDDTGPIATAIQKARTDPKGAAAETLPRLVAHEQTDKRNWRIAAYVGGLLLSAVLAGAGYAAQASAERTEMRAHIEDVQLRLERIEQQTDARLERIEQQMDRLLERTDR